MEEEEAEDSDGVGLGGLEDFKFKLEDFGRGIGIGNMDNSLRAGKLPALRAGSMPRRPAFDASVRECGGCLVEEGIIASGVRPKAEDK